MPSWEKNHICAILILKSKEGNHLGRDNTKLVGFGDSEHRFLLARERTLREQYKGTGFLQVFWGSRAVAKQAQDLGSISSSEK